VYAATAYLAGATVPANQEFVKKYQERFQEKPDIHAALAYDGIRLLLDALRRAQPMQPPKIRAELGQTQEAFPSLTGPLTFDRDRVVHRPIFVVRVVRGEPKIVKTSDAEGK